MRILLVEDDDAKRDQIVSYLRTAYRDPTILHAASFRSALGLLVEKNPTLILLDMTMPTFEDAGRPNVRPLVYGGRDVLRQMRRLSLKMPVIVITQYDQFGEGPDAVTLKQLDAELRTVYPESYTGAVSFSFVYDTWKAQLDRLMTAAGYPPLERRDLNPRKGSE